MREINKISEALFEKIRDRFEDVSLGDKEAKVTQDPADARFFNFDYIVDDKNYGNVTISLVDEQSLKIYFSRNITSALDDQERKQWYAFLKDLRNFSRRNLLSFEPRDITRSTLKKRDIETAATSDDTYTAADVELGESTMLSDSQLTEIANKKQSQQLATALKRAGIGHTVESRVGYDKYLITGTEYVITADGVGYSLFNGYDELAYTNNVNEIIVALEEILYTGLNESRMYGSRKSSYQNEGSTRIIVRHNEAVDPEKHGARSRKIKSIFVENSEGERIKLPHNNLRYARAMARHINEGGVLHDEFGQYITQIAEECKQLYPFKTKIVRRTFEDAETQAMANATLEYYTDLTKKLKKLSGRRGYYSIKENFVADDEQVIMDNFNVDALRERFARKTYDENIDSALPLVQKAYEMKKHNQYAQEFEQWANTVAEGTWAKADTPEEVMELAEILSEPLEVGVDAVNATSALYDLLGDDTLFDLLLRIAREDGPETDVSTTVRQWLANNMTDLSQQLEQQLKNRNRTNDSTESDDDELDESVAEKMRALAAAGLLAGGAAALQGTQTDTNPVIDAMQTAMHSAKLAGDAEQYNQIQQELKKVKSRLDIGRDLNYVEQMAKKYGATDNSVNESTLVDIKRLAGVK